MLHCGKNPEGELEIRATGKSVRELWRAIFAASHEAGSDLRILRECIESNFWNEV